MSSRLHQIGMVVPSLANSGGVSAVARFLCEVIDDCDWLDYRLVSLPSSSRDRASVRMASPTTWLRGPVVEEATWLGRTFEHVGAVMAELEFQRYRPRPILTQRLRECDLIQVVAGSPAWALVARDAGRPVALQVATLASVERESRFCEEGGLITKWRRLMTRFTACLDRKGVRFADRVFVENQWMRDTVAEWTDPGKVVLAPPGVDTDVYCPASEESMSDPGYILSVGRFGDRRKNVRLLFEAYAGLCGRNEDPPLLVLAGKSGPRDEDWSKAVQLGIRDRVCFHESVSRSRLAELYREASLFALPSSEEGLGIVLLEAMASGLPVVSTATQGAREAVEDGSTGILIPIGDARALCDAVQRLLNDPTSARKMGRRGRVRAERRYSKEAAGRHFLEGYRELVGQRDPDPRASGRS